MIIQVNLEYRKFWKQWAKHKASTSTYSLFLERLESEPEYKLSVDTYIASSRTPSQQQRAFEQESDYG